MYKMISNNVSPIIRLFWNKMRTQLSNKGYVAIHDDMIVHELSIDPLILR